MTERGASGLESPAARAAETDAPNERDILAREQRALITRRVAPFAIGWLGTMAIWIAVFASEGRLTPVAALVVGAEALVLLGTVWLCRVEPAAPRVLPLVLGTCVALGVASMSLVAIAHSPGEILAFILFTLYLATALVFGWGWRAELVLQGATLATWVLLLDRFTFLVGPLEVSAAVAIGALLALAIAEGTARSFRYLSFRRRSQGRVTRQLADSRNAYRDLAEHARDLIWACDLELRFTYVNEAATRFLGLPATKILGRLIPDFYSANAGNPDAHGLMARAVAEGELAPFLAEMATPLGPRWIEVVSSLVRDARGAPSGLRGIGRDVTERVAAETALRESEERFRSAFDHAAIGKVVVGMDGKPLQVNRAFCEMLGYEPAELATRTMDTLAHPADVALATTETLRLVMGEMRAFQMEKRYVHKDGHLVWCLLSCSLTRDALGQPLHLIAQFQDINERKAAEEALRTSEARYRGLVESQQEMIVRLDAGGRFTFVNDAYLAKVGKPGGALLGQTFFDLVHPDDYGLVAAAMEALARPPHRVLLEIRNFMAEGVRWIAWEGGMVLDETGRLVEAQAAGRDVTERRAAEDGLRASEARYRGLVQSAHEQVTRLDLDGRLTFANDAYCQAIGYRRDDIVGRNPIFLVHPDDRAETLVAFGAVLRPPYRGSLESRELTSQGWRWFEWEISGVRDASERVIEVQQVGRDVTARRQAEGDLRESEDRFRSAFEDAAVGMGVTTIAGHLVRVNRAFCDMFGYAEHELLGRGLYDIVHPEDREVLRHDQEQLLNGVVQTYRGERRYLGADGGVIWTVATASIVRDHEGKPLYVIGQLQDVTERQLAAEALKGSLEDLRCSEEKLRLLAQRQVTIREEERKRLGFDLHDDVCQELVGVGILVAALRRKLAPMPVESAAEFDRVVSYLGEVVEHLRVLARELRPLLLRDLGLDGSLRSLADGMSSATLQVVTDFQATIPRLDEEAEVSVYRIAQEALANAVRHARARRIVVALAAADGMLRLEVRDDGRGFDPSARPMVALGLASMEERALALGGRLDIRSVPGAGTTIVLACPLEARISGQLREPADPSPTRSSSLPSTTTTPRSAARD